MTEISLKDVNQMFDNIENLRNSNKRVSKTEAVGDEYSTTWEEIYRLEHDGIFLKMVFVLNSYNEDEKLSSIQFVKPVTKTIVANENI